MIQTAELMARLVDVMMVNQRSERHDEFRAQMTPQHYRYEFQTVNLYGPRQSGFTTVAQYCWDKYNAIVVHPKFDLQRWFVEDLHKQGFGVNFRPDAHNRCFVPRDEGRGADALKQFLHGIKNTTHPDDRPKMIVFDGMSRIPHNKMPGWEGIPGRTVDEIVDITFAVFPDSMKGVVGLQ